MNYAPLVNPELRRDAKRIPFNRAIIRLANLYNVAARAPVRVPQGVTSRAFSLAGSGGLPFKTTVFEPAGAQANLPALLYLHGGAFCYRAAAYHKRLACIYAARANCRVFFPDYHLAPRHSYPAACEDAVALYRYVTDHAQELRVDAARVAVGGDSAGGTLAALLCCRYEKENLVRPCAQMLVYPALDAEPTESMRRFTDTPVWNAVNHKKIWPLYVQSEAEKRDAMPMQNALPAVVPAAYIETAQYDCLHDEGVLYAARLQTAGAAVTLNETRGTFHGYDTAIKTHIAQENIARRVEFLNECFYPAPHVAP